MGIASDSIALAILVGLVRSGAISREQLDAVVDELWQSEARIGETLPKSAAKVERFITALHHQLRLDLPSERKRE